MLSMETLVSIYLIFGGGLAFLFAVTRSTSLSRLFFFTTACWQFFGGLHHLDPTTLPRINLLVPAMGSFCLSVPLGHALWLKHHTPRPIPWARLSPLFLPALAGMAALVPLWDSPRDLRRAMTLATPDPAPAMLLATLTLYLSIILLVIHGSYQAAERRKRPHAPFWCRPWIPPVLGLAWILDRLFHLGLVPLFYAGATTAGILLFISTQQKRETPAPRPPTSHLNRTDPDHLVLRATDLMENGRAWADEQLNLSTMAEKLDITSHQLSELLSRHMSTRFYSWVNHYRIREARELLRDHPDQKIISIAFEVGFNSPSAFYKAFKLETGMAPGQYRAKAGGP